MTNRQPPRTWEPWIAGLLILLWLSAANNKDVDPLTRDLFLFAAIGWFISIAVRLRSFRQAQATKSLPPLPPPTTPAVKHEQQEPNFRDNTADDFAERSPKPKSYESHELGSESEVASIEAWSEDVADILWGDKDGFLFISPTALMFRSKISDKLWHTFPLNEIRAVSVDPTFSLGSRLLIVELSDGTSMRYRAAGRLVSAFCQKANEAISKPPSG